MYFRSGFNSICCPLVDLALASDFNVSGHPVGREMNNCHRRPKRRRKYLQLADAAVEACTEAIDNFNKVHGYYKTETALILLTNAWELLAKAVLVKKYKSESIFEDRSEEKTISCQEAIKKLLELKEIDQGQNILLQQIISLRNQCVHISLPEVPEEVQHHLLFFGCKFFKELCTKHFSTTEEYLNKNFLTLSYDKQVTYAAQVKSMVSKMRRSKSSSNKELIWLLERGVRYAESGEYISQKKFEKLYMSKKKIMPYLSIKKYIQNADMIKIVFIQAPSNHTADINIKKAPRNQQAKDSLPVIIRKTDIENDYPYLTQDLAEKLGKDLIFVAEMTKDLGLKGDSEYHQQIRTSRKKGVQRYSEKVLGFLQNHLKKDPSYNPYKQRRQHRKR